MSNSFWYVACGGSLLFLVEYVHYYKLRQQVKEVEAWTPPPPSEFQSPIGVVLDVYRDCKANLYSFESFLSHAHLGAPVQFITTGNYESFLAWAVYKSHLTDISPEQKKVIRGLCDHAVELFGIPIQGESNPDISHINVGLVREPFSYIHQPLCIRKCIEFRDWIFYKQLQSLQFEYHVSNEIPYWYRRHASTTQSPIVCFHGVGIGWAGYSTFIREMIRERSVILICYNSILVHKLELNVPNSRQITTAVQHMMQRHAISTISVFGYSWGSFQAAWLVKLMPIEIDHVYLIDPVTLFMQYCGIPYSFIFKPPTNVSDQIFHLFYRKNVSLSNIIQNHFAWYNMVLYFSDFPKNMGVFISISGKDCFLDGPQAIRRTQHWANANADTRTAPTQVLYQENKSHGDVLDQVDVLQSIARGTIYTQ